MSIYNRVKLIAKQTEIVRKFKDNQSIATIAEYYRCWQAQPDDVEEILRNWMVNHAEG